MAANECKNYLSRCPATCTSWHVRHIKDLDQPAHLDIGAVIVESLIGALWAARRLNVSSGRKLSIFVCFVALRPKSTAMVMTGRSVHITTLFPGQA